MSVHKIYMYIRESGYNSHYYYTNLPQDILNSVVKHTQFTHTVTHISTPGELNGFGNIYIFYYPSSEEMVKMGKSNAQTILHIK